MINKIKVGDKVKHIASNTWETVESILYNDTTDIRSLEDNRVTINGTYWYMSDIKAVKPNNN